MLRSKKGTQQAERELGGLVAGGEDRVHLNHIDGAEAAVVGDPLHQQVALAVAQTAGRLGTDPQAIGSISRST